MKSQVAKPQIHTILLGPVSTHLNLLQYFQMTISKFHKSRSEIYICSSSFSTLLLQNFILLSGAEEKSGNFGDYLAALNNSVFGCLRAEFSLTACDHS